MYVWLQAAALNSNSQDDGGIQVMYSLINASHCNSSTCVLYDCVWHTYQEFRRDDHWSGHSNPMCTAPHVYQG